MTVHYIWLGFHKKMFEEKPVKSMVLGLTL